MNIAVRVKPHQGRVRSRALQTDQRAQNGETVTSHDPRDQAGLSTVRHFRGQGLIEDCESSPLVRGGKGRVDGQRLGARREPDAQLAEPLILVKRQNDDTRHGSQAMRRQSMRSAKDTMIPSGTHQERTTTTLPDARPSPT